MKAVIVTLALLLSLMIKPPSGTADSCSTSYCLVQSTLNSAGVSVVGSTYQLTSSMGQELVVGCSSSPHYVLQSGFWSFSGSTLVPVVLTVVKSGGDPNNPQLDWSGNNSPYSIYRNSACDEVFNSLLTSTTSNTYTDNSPLSADLSCYNLLATAPGFRASSITEESADMKEIHLGRHK